MATAAYNTIVKTATGGGGFGTTLQGVNNVSVSMSRNLVDVTQLDGTKTFVQRLATLKDGPLTLSGFFLPTDTAYGHIKANFVSGTQLGIELSWDAVPNKVTCTNYQVESIEISATPDGAQEVSISLQSNADIVIS
jgi:predicted secreted protein